MSLCILDPAGQTLLYRDFPADPRAFLDAVVRRRADLLADLVGLCATAARASSRAMTPV